MLVLIGDSTQAGKTDRTGQDRQWLFEFQDLKYQSLLTHDNKIETESLQTWAHFAYGREVITCFNISQHFNCVFFVIAAVFSYELTTALVFQFLKT